MAKRTIVETTYFLRKSTRSPTRETRLCLKTPSLARERVVFRLARTVKQAILDISSMQPDAVQAENKPLEARSSFQTEPRMNRGPRQYGAGPEDISMTTHSA